MIDRWVTESKIDEVLQWYLTQDIDVGFGDKPRIDLFERKVVLDEADTNEDLFCAALHEAGHFRVNEKGDWSQKYPIRQEVRDGTESEDSSFSALELLHEEMEAWEEGRQLAVELFDWDVGQEDYWIQRKANALMSYVRFVVKQTNEEFPGIFTGVL